LICKKCGHSKYLHDELECNGSPYFKEQKELHDLQNKGIEISERSIQIDKLRTAKLNHGGSCFCEGFKFDL